MTDILYVEPISLPTNLSIPNHFQYALEHVTAPIQVPVKQGRLGGLFDLVPGIKETRNQTPPEIRLRIKEIQDELRNMNAELGRERFHFQNKAAQQANRRAYLINCLQHYQMADYGFPLQMNMSYLSKCRPGTSMPYFGVLNLHDSVFTISCSKTWGTANDPIFTPKLPEDLAGHYSVTTQYLNSLIPKLSSGTASFSARYSGSMPQALEDYIQIVVNSSFFEKIWVIFELPEELKLNVEVRVSKDPIIVGQYYMPLYFPNMPRTYYFLGMFNHTEEEELVARYFTSRI
jgi:hypothetical protein